VESDPRDEPSQEAEFANTTGSLGELCDAAVARLRSGARASFSVKIHRRVSHYRQCVLLLGGIIGLLRLRQAQ
jgi:hypothetical protein